MKEIDLSITEEPKMLKCMRNLRQSSNYSQSTTSKKRNKERETSWFRAHRNRNRLFRKLKIRRPIIVCFNIRYWESLMKNWFRRFTTLTRINLIMNYTPRCRGKQNLLLITISIRELLHSLHLQKEFYWVTLPTSRTFPLSRPNLTYWNSILPIKVLAR